MLRDKRLSKAQMSYMIQSDGFICNMLGNLGKKVITDLAMLFARDKIGLVNHLAPFNAKIKVEREIGRKKAVGEGKIFTLFILNENMNDIINTIK